MIALIAMFFACAGALSGAVSALMLTGIIVLGVALTFLWSRVLSATVLRGVPSGFTLELPPYRKPQFGQVLVRSVLDRTLFVLGRAVRVAAPAGLLIWCMANISVSGQTLLAWCSGFLDAPARLLGLDGVILMAFLLGLPANEIVIPIIIMAYTCTGTLTDYNGYAALRELLAGQGWTALTALNTLLFSLLHWPCATTLQTVQKETGRLRWTLLAAALPTVCGILLCLCTTAVFRLFGWG